MKIKVGVIAVFVIMLAIGGWVGFKSLPSMLYNGGQFNTLLKWFPNDDQTSLVLMEKLNDIIPPEVSWGDNNIFIMSQGGWSSSGSGLTTKEQRSEARSKLEQLIAEHPTIPFTNTLRLEVAKLYMWDQEWDNAQQFLHDIEGSPNEFFRRDELHNYLEILESRQVDPEVTPSLKGNVKIGDEPADNIFVVLQRSNNNSWHSPPYGHYPIAITDKEGNYQFSGIGPGQYVVGVGARPEGIDGYYLTENKIKTVEISQEQTGEYNFQFVPQIRTTSPVNQETIQGDELKFQWEPYEGADYYQVMFTSTLTSKDASDKSTSASTRSISEEKFRDTIATFSIEELRNQSEEVIKNTDRARNVILWPNSILGTVYPGGNFKWSVDAYAEDGRKLSSSAGHFIGSNNKLPLFSLPEDGMLEGDKLVLEHRYAEAIEAYKRAGDDNYALRKLARLVANGIKVDDEGEPAEALTYLKRIKAPNKFDKSYMLKLEERLKKSEK